MTNESHSLYMPNVSSLKYMGDAGHIVERLLRMQEVRRSDVPILQLVLCCEFIDLGCDWNCTGIPTSILPYVTLPYVTLPHTG